MTNGVVNKVTTFEILWLIFDFNLQLNGWKVLYTVRLHFRIVITTALLAL